MQIDKEFDLVIIGGGASGSGIALDASSRGYSVLLLEQNDFASGTSSKSTKLVHGGVRYLEKAVLEHDLSQYNLVKEALYERSLFLQNASNFSKPLNIITPLYEYLQIPYIYSGLFLYHLIAGKKEIGNNSYISKEDLKEIHPSVKKKDLVGGVSYFDGSFLDSKMVISLLQTAQEYGVVCKNYCRVESFLYENKKIVGFEYFDKKENKNLKVKAKVVVNASGANVDKIRKIDDKNCEDILSLSSGVHIILDKKYLPSNEGLLIPKTEDGRVLFILPWQGYCLVGTTDEKIKSSENIRVLDSDIKYLLKELNRYFDVEIKQKDILSSWVGVRPLIKADKNTTESLVREHSIEKSFSNLVSIAGGKWTTYRKMAEDMMEFLENEKLLNKKEECKTKELKLIGSRINRKIIKKELMEENLLKKTRKLLLRHYGDNALEVIKLAKGLKDGFDLLDEELPFIKAELYYTVENEFVKNAEDFIARRINLSFVDLSMALVLVRPVCEILADIFSWDKNRLEMEIKESRKSLENEFSIKKNYN